MATSRRSRVFARRASTHWRSTSGIRRFLLSLLVGTETETIDWVVGSVSYTTETLYREAGKGGGGVNVKVCVSRIMFDFAIAERVVFARRTSGAKAVRKEDIWEDSFKANGFVGKGDVG